MYHFETIIKEAKNVVKVPTPQWQNTGKTHYQHYKEIQLVFSFVLFDTLT